MERAPFSSPAKNARAKEVFKEEPPISSPREKPKGQHHGLGGGRDSPESVSLYSDYESGQQYEQDLPSGYNSGEQYDTLSTGYMSGEAYELPEARVELQEPTLASIEEVSTRSNEDLFTIQMPENQLLVQTERLDSSSSSDIGQDPLDPVGLQDTVPHKGKRKKTVSYCVSVPLDKSPLAHEQIRAYRELPSDTDTTSCFDSDGTYMREGGQSSDSGAALLVHSTKKKRSRDGTETGIIRGNLGGRKRKSRGTRRNHDQFFLVYDNKAWALARQVCFWCSVVAILLCIMAATTMIILMPHACDPELDWWQGSVIMEVGPQLNSDGQPWLDLKEVIAEVALMHKVGVRGIKLINLYGNSDNLTNEGNFIYANDFDALKSRVGDLKDISVLASTLHSANMTLLVDIPTLSPNSTVEPELDFKITKAIQFWARSGVDGIGLVGLHRYAADRYVTDRVSAWSTDFEKFSPNSQRILLTSYLLPESIEISEASLPVSGSNSVSRFNLLDAAISLSENQNFSHIKDDILRANKWDKAPASPWILWHSQGQEQLNGAQLSFQIFLPGTISLPRSVLSHSTSKPNQTHGAGTGNSSNGGDFLLAQLIEARKKAVPLYMNGNYKVCHGVCEGNEREDNFKIHVFDGPLVVMERHYNRRNRYLLVANFGSLSASVHPVGSLFSSGELVVDTSGTHTVGETIKFKSMSGIPPQSALVIKLPK